ncbi:MAG: TerB family tellurite resistance protein, partial [Elusimicrobia bacterium]|nr:TerB family tellurite resistance protein [Elusimicrobiota bacterium]
RRWGLIEGQCPNCGAGLKINDKSNCSACGSLVASAEYDWTLVKITQEEEWRFREHKREVRGVAAYLASDPGFNVSFMEDRVSAVFWRHQQALLERNVDPLRKVALASFCESLPLSPEGAGYGSVAVGVTEITSVQFGDPHDRVKALVKWAGVPLNSDTGQSGGYSGKKFYSHIFAFVRKRGVQTSLARGLLSLHCPGCGAPERASHHAGCSYCGLPLGAGDHDWVLESVSPVAMADFGGGPGKSADEVNAVLLDPIGLLSVLIVASMADGKLDPAEQTVLETFAQKRRIPKERVGELFRAHQAGVLRLPAPETLVESAQWLDDLVEMCFVDGGVSDTERSVLISLGKTMGHSAADVDLRVRRKKTKLYKEARAALRVPEPADPYV